MKGRALGRSVAGLVVVGAILVASAANAATPQALFTADSSGMLKINVVCAHDAHQYGSGFLLGPKLMMTARHVLVDGITGNSCKAIVVQDGTRKTARVVRWMAIRATRSNSPTDLAIGVLSTPLKGYDFSLSAATPKPGKLVIALGYGLTQPLSLNQGHVTKLSFHDSVRLLEMNLAEEPGASGGPILDANGKVVGLVQIGAAGSQESVDLAHLVHDDPTQLCFGAAVGQTSTICPPHGSSASSLSPDGPPELCAGYTIDAPFEDCPKLADDLTGLVQLKTTCPTSGAGVASGFLLGPRLVMTARSALIDTDTAASCKATAIQRLTQKSARVSRWMGIQVASGKLSTDLALAVLATPLKGYNFSLSTTSPERGQSVNVLSYLFPLPDSFNRGHVESLPTFNDLRMLKVAIKSALGDAGGPIVNARNQVVGVLQADSTTTVESVDLAQLTHGDVSQLCFGYALGLVATICMPALNEAPVTFVRDVPPEVCGKRAADPPFTFCESAGALATPSITACWVSTTTSADPSTKIDQVTDVYPGVYFHIQLDSPGTAAVTDSVTLRTTEDGTTRLITNASVAGFGSSFYYGPQGWNHNAVGHIDDGVWTYKVTLSSGGSCSASFTTARP